MKTLTTFTLALAALVVSSTGCSHVAIDTPPGFAQIDDGAKDRRFSGYDYRATNAEGVVLGVRQEKNDPSGDLEFWSGAVDAHLRRSGYEATEAVQVQSKDGVDGRQIRYTVEHGGRPHVFWATVFVTGRAVVTVEVGGDAEWFEARRDAVTAAIGSVSVS